MKNDNNMKTNLLTNMKNIEMKIMMVSDVLVILESWQGKQVNKRIVNEFYKIYGDKYRVYLEADKYSSYFRLEVNYKGDSISITLCPKENKKFDLSFCKEKESYLFNNTLIDNLNKYKKALDLVDTWSDRLDKINNERDTLIKEMEVYGCRYII